MKKFIEIAKEAGVSKEEIEQMLIDRDLFLNLNVLFNSMSKRGKYVTIETLIMNLLEEE